MRSDKSISPSFEVLERDFTTMGLSNRFLVCTAFSLAVDVVAGILSSQQLEKLAEV